MNMTKEQVIEKFRKTKEVTDTVNKLKQDPSLIKDITVGQMLILHLLGELPNMENKFIVILEEIVKNQKCEE